VYNDVTMKRSFLRKKPYDCSRKEHFTMTSYLPITSQRWSSLCARKVIKSNISGHNAREDFVVRNALCYSYSQKYHCLRHCVSIRELNFVSRSSQGVKASGHIIRFVTSVPLQVSFHTLFSFF